jgi:hypothetical protein
VVWKVGCLADGCGWEREREWQIVEREERIWLRRIVVLDTLESLVHRKSWTNGSGVDCKDKRSHNLTTYALPHIGVLFLGLSTRSVRYPLQICQLKTTPVDEYLSFRQTQATYAWVAILSVKAVIFSKMKYGDGCFQ